MIPLIIALAVTLPAIPAVVQLVGGLGLVVFGLVIWKGRRRAD